MAGWNFADAWEAIAERVPERTAQVQGARRVSWADFDRRADGIAATLLARGAGPQATVAQYLHNAPEYLESMFGAWKAGLVPINTNYRYVDDELVYLWDNADCVAAVFHGTFTPRIERIRSRVPRLTTWLWVDDGSGPCPAWAVPYEEAAGAGGAGRTVAPWGRSGDQLLMLYTGGTTGRPKGVLWRQDDLWRGMVGAVDDRFRTPVADLDLVRARLDRTPIVGLPACPLMHGTGCFAQLVVLSLGGTVVMPTSQHLDVDELLDTIERERVRQLVLVGDAFAQPMVRALDRHPDRWDVSSLVVVMSSGVMWSEATKDRLLAHNPRMALVDMYASSEALGVGSAVSTDGATTGTARFAPGPATRVIDDDGQDVVPGSGRSGRVVVGGFVPLGYHKDPERTATTCDQTYGYRRVHAQLADEGIEAGQELVRSIMVATGLVVCQPKPYKVTTITDGTDEGPADLCRRDFTSNAPGTKLVGDITYIATWGGWVYLATVIDCYSKAVIGYAMADHMRTSLVIDALDMARRNSSVADGCIFHSDRGSQYTSTDLAVYLAIHGIRGSMGRTGVCLLTGQEERSPIA